MRCGLTRAVSSALLLTLVVAMPHHDGSTCERSSASAMPEAHGFLISEFYPSATCDDEYLVISNCGDSTRDLQGWSVTDGEGCILFFGALPVAPRSSCAISWNGTSYRNVFDLPPRVAVDEPDPRSSLVLNGTFRLGDSGDSVTLLSPQNTPADFVAYGSSNATSPLWTGEPIPNIKRGEVVKRISDGATLIDTDDATDWMHFREFRYGYTEHPTTSYSIGAGNVTAFTSPDSTLDVVLDTIDCATKSVSICTYEFSSVPVSLALLRADSRGVVVRLLLDGSPVGGMDPDEIACLSVLVSDGIDVRTVRGNSSKGAVAHLGEMHAKYLVVDHAISIVMSENLVEQGAPTDRLFGNRGWGISVNSHELARAIELILEGDSRTTRPDVVSWTADERCNRSASLPASPTTNHSKGIAAPLTSSESATVTVYASPDCSPVRPYLCAMLEYARSLEAEQFQADLFWEDRWTSCARTSPILDDIIESLKRGGSARLLLDSLWFNLVENSEVIESMSENATLAGMDGQFALLDSISPIQGLHNKGAVIDGRHVLVSSNNWVYASFARNRELGLMIDSPEIAEYFSAVFALDWIPDTSPPIADAGQDRTISVGEKTLISGNRSWDDRAIASFSWDTDGDGEPESRNQSVEFVGACSGTYHVLLTVEDAWGNKATDDVTVSVLALNWPEPGPGGSFARALGWTVPLVLGAAILFARWRRGRNVMGGPRKLNLGRRS